MSSTINVQSTPYSAKDTHQPQVQEASLVGLLVTLVLAGLVWYIGSSIWAWLFGPRVLVDSGARPLGGRPSVTGAAYPYTGQTVFYRGGTPGYYYEDTWVPVISVGGVYGYYDDGVFIEQPSILIEQGAGADYIEQIDMGFVDNGFGGEQRFDAGGYVDNSFTEQSTDLAGQSFEEQTNGGYADKDFDQQIDAQSGFVDADFGVEQRYTSSDQLDTSSDQLDTDSYQTDTDS